MAADKICLFMPTLAGGGAERIMITLAEALVSAGLLVDLVVSTAVGALRSDVPRKVRLIDLAAPRLVRSTMPLAAYLRRERPDVILSATIEANCIAVWARALSRTRVRLVLSEHSNLSLATAHEPAWRKRWLPCFARWAYPHADAVVAVSIGVADDLASAIAFPRRRIQVIYNPVITPAMLDKSREPLNHPWFEPGQPPVVLGVGRLAAPKDYPTLIRAFAILRKERPLRLIILGEGEQREALTALIGKLGIGEDVTLPGFVKNPYQYMRAARVFALSSRWEGLPTVVVEALACGANVVSTNCPSGPSEILENGKWGYLVPVGSPEYFAAAMNEALDQNRAMPGLALALDRFDVAQAVSKYLNILVLSKR